MTRESHAGFCESGEVKFLSATLPQAHEHDAERAVWAGLALIEAVPKLKPAAGLPLQMRVEIATRLVIVGEALSGWSLLARSR